jgi:hypothetical protein
MGCNSVPHFGSDQRYRPDLCLAVGGAISEAVFEVIEHAPQRLLEVEGIGPKRARRITASWADQKIIREIMGVSARARSEHLTCGTHIQGLWSRCHPARQPKSLSAGPRYHGHSLQIGRPYRRAARDLAAGDSPGKLRRSAASSSRARVTAFSLTKKLLADCDPFFSGYD